jgi:hypothetical protein
METHQEFDKHDDGEGKTIDFRCYVRLLEGNPYAMLGYRIVNSFIRLHTNQWNQYTNPQETRSLTVSGTAVPLPCLTSIFGGQPLTYKFQDG